MPEPSAGTTLSSPSRVVEGPWGDRTDHEVEGRWFYATDHNLLYRYNGDQWDAQSGPGNASHQLPGTVHRESVSTDALGIAGFERVEKDGEIDVGGETHGSSNKVTYTISDTGKDAYILILESFGVDGGGSSDHKMRYNGYGSGSGEDDYEFVDSSGKTANSAYLGLGEDIGVGGPFTGAWLIEHYDGLQDSAFRNTELCVTQIRGGFGVNGTGLQAGGVFDSDDLAPPLVV